MNQAVVEPVGERLRMRLASWPAAAARNSYVLLAVFGALVLLGRLAGGGLTMALGIGALVAGWLSSWSP
jgi:hypothetical protein